MKNLVFTLCLLIVSIAFVACDEEKLVSIDKLPTTAQTFIQTHFPAQEATRIEKDRDSYDVYLANGVSIDFTKSGDWDDVDCRGQEMPASIIALIPEAISAYVAEHYPNQFISEINKEHFGYEIDLNNYIELEFNKTGAFLRLDY
ncbi:PepSY-like domain-containing protein [Bacteroides sp. UBA939]|uniref:PepSY-like domain-containing protein n=1 Tax=Bacteroides sp. UBA939 TaxID=1946092 RepID=UPI0025C0C240|nr:PepSY-like domain-containing protein [Bacteroides sp. UBA939]